MTKIMIKTDLRALFGPVRDQGQRSTCLAFATSDTHAALRGAWAPLSCEFLFYHAQRRANRKPSQGALLDAMLDALRHDGQPHESGWTYLVDDPADVSKWLPPAGVAPLFRRAAEEKQSAMDTIIAELTQGRPVIVLTCLSWSFDWVRPDGIVDEATSEKPDMNRRHAVIAVGHGDIGGQRAMLIRNSWGDGWGAGGYGWLTEKYAVPRVFQIAILKEDLSVSPGSATT
jgi:C1A family cysteine protease